VSASWAIAGTSPFSSNLISIYLTPSFPLSFKGEGEDSVKRGCAPLKLPIRLFLSLIWIYIPIMRGSRGLGGAKPLQATPDK